jgi:RHS repeat-associated protein
MAKQQNGSNGFESSTKNPSASSSNTTKSFLTSSSGKTKSNAIEVPSISLPKGGGAIKGIDEKFSVNAINGTSSFSIPVPTSPARGVTPSLSLSYNSGSGNGIFGLGWNVGLSSIKRKTDKGLPQYQDSTDSDTFLFSEAEDLVPVLINLKIDERPSPNGDFVVRLYRPRIEGLFARIERWTRKTDGEIKWRVITRDNITTLFGWSAASRIADPENSLRVYEWLPEFVFDDKGNSCCYVYKKENNIAPAGQKQSLHNKNRFDSAGSIRYTNLYLEKVFYGNTKPFEGFASGVPSSIDKDYLFKIFFDYTENTTPIYRADNSLWTFRDDAFSDYKAGFEIRTTRLCQRILLFHQFNEYNGLVKSMEFTYDQQSTRGEFTFLKKITSKGHIKPASSTSPYTSKSLPPIEFEYQAHSWNKEVKTILAEDLVHAPSGLDESAYQFTDLFNEGLAGILTEQANAWYYKHNLGNGKFAQAKLVTPKPSFAGLGGQLQLVDLDGDGGKQLANYSTEPKGFFELTDEEEWIPYKSFVQLPNMNISGGHARMLDLNGDGKPEVLLTEDHAFTWYESEGRKGFTQARHTIKQTDEEEGPHVVFADSTQSIFLADMSGDGMTDIVRIRNGEVCYWPNLGYGKFGRKVGMDNAPLFDHSDAFNPTYIKLADIDGSGTTDIIYLGKNTFSCWLNRSGNSFQSAPEFEIPHFPETHSEARVTITDLLGNGVACIVWSSALAKDAHAPLRYIDLMDSTKPHVMTHYRNNMGKEVTLEYKASTHFYLEDKKAGKPWVTKLHFPVHCLVKTTTIDRWRKTSFSSTYSYHHGYYDHAEREFRGFGRVEQIDIEDFGLFAAGNSSSPYITSNKNLYQPPVKSITWYHTGASLERNRILTQFQHEYYSPSSATFKENALPEPDIASLSLSSQEWREALRACKGMMLRQEVYELDVDALANKKEERVKLFSTAFHNCHIKRLQPREQNQHAVFLVTESEAISYTYELDLLTTTPQLDPRIAHTLNLSTDEFGNVLESVAIAYHRIGRHTDPALSSTDQDLIAIVQQENHVAYTKNAFTILDSTITISANDHRLPLPCEVKTCELTGILPVAGFYFTLAELRNANISSWQEIPYHTLPDLTKRQKRGVELVRNLYFKDDLSTPLPFGSHNYLGLPYETYKLALTRSLLDAIYTDAAGHNKLLQSIDGAQTVLNKLNDPKISGYLSGTLLQTRFASIPATELSGQYWIRSGIAGFASDAADHFYLPERYTDPFENISNIEYDGQYDLFIQSTTDALGNSTSVSSFDYRVLSPREMIDANENVSEVWYDALGLPIAVAMRGKGSQGDSLTNFTHALANPSIDALVAFFVEDDYDEASPANPAKIWLGNATVRHVYYFGEVEKPGDVIEWGVHPACACGIVREQHVAAGSVSPIQVGFEYSDGMGTVLVKKTQAEPAKGSTILRWIASGKTILNNKGKPVKQYEPYFSPSAHKFEELVEVGVTPVMYYDSAGRLIRTEMPDGTYSRFEFSPWFVKIFDANDTVVETNNAWYQRMSSGSSEEKRAAGLASVHGNTPAQTHLDSLGREVISIAHNRIKDSLGPIEINGEKYRNEFYLTFTKLDTEGKPLWIKDARRSLVMQYVFPYDEDNRKEPQTFTPCYDISGNLLFQHSMDAGDRWTINDAADKPMFAWDVYKPLDISGSAEEKRLYFTQYDQLHRPTGLWLKINSASPIQIERYEYNDTRLANRSPNPNLALLIAANLIGKLKRHYNAGGLVETIAFDFKGNPLEVNRQLLLDKKSSITDWQNTPGTKLETTTYIQITEYDALNRMQRQFNWHQAGGRVAVYKPSYNQRGVLKSEELIVGATKANTTTGPTPGYSGGTTSNAIADIRYNVKGQREYLKLGNGVVTRYGYDEKTFRLRQLRSTRPGAAQPFPSHHSGLKDASVLQQLHYTYDPVGNITDIYDEAFEPVYFQNQQVEAHSQYQYDALYRLIEASGRENGALRGAPNHKEGNATEIQFPVQQNNANALRKYTQSYEYDAVGNIKQMRHVAGTGSWTRTYAYTVDEPAKPASNRLFKTWTGSNPATNSITYQYDSHGSILNLANVPNEFSMQWDYRDMIASVNLGNGTAHYQYDSNKQRTRKYRDYGNKADERIYLGGLEIYQRTQNGMVVEEIETLHLFDGEQRLLMVDQIIKTDNTRLGVGNLYRYTLSNHLGSSTLELDEHAQLISYEEYHPYGTSAYLAGRNEAEVKLKRYRYTGMERDEETGLAYHSARYYLPWVGRWASADPIGIGDGLNIYSYANQSPIQRSDRTGLAADKSTPGKTANDLGYKTHRSLDRLMNAQGIDTSNRTFTEEGIEVTPARPKGSVEIDIVKTGPFVDSKASGVKSVSSEYLRKKASEIAVQQFKHMVATKRSQVALVVSYNKDQDTINAMRSTLQKHVDRRVRFEVNKLKKSNPELATELKGKRVGVGVTSIQKVNEMTKVALEKNPQGLKKSPGQISPQSRNNGTGTANIVGTLTQIAIPKAVGGSAAEALSMLTQGALDWVQTVGPQAAITGLTVAATSLAPKLGTLTASVGASVGAAFNATSIGAIASAGVGAMAVSAAGVAIAGTAGYAIGQGLNERLVSSGATAAIDQFLNRSGAYDLSYNLFFK